MVSVMDIQTFRTANRYNVAQFAALVGCSPSTIHRLESGEIVSPSRGLVMAIVRATGGAVMPNDLYPELETEIAAAEAAFAQ